VCWDSLGELQLLDWHKEVMEVVSGCVGQEWPMVITGQSQVGKTAILLLLAQLVGAKVGALIPWSYLGNLSRQTLTDRSLGDLSHVGHLHRDLQGPDTLRADRGQLQHRDDEHQLWVRSCHTFITAAKNNSTFPDLVVPAAKAATRLMKVMYSVTKMVH
jgi:hypothetical protein